MLTQSVLTISISIHLPTPQAGAILAYGDIVYVKIHRFEERSVTIVRTGFAATLL